MRREDLLRTLARVDRHRLPDDRRQRGYVPEIVILQGDQLLPHLVLKALTALTPVAQQALKVKTRVFGMAPQVAEPVDYARVGSCGAHRANVGRQRGQPFDGARA